MKRIRKYYIPNLCISFTLIIIISAIYNLVNHNDPTGHQRFILQLAGSLCFMGFVDYLLEKIEFKRWTVHITLQAVVNYIILFSSGYLFHWIGFRLSNIIYFTVVFIIIFVIIYTHTYQLMKQEDKRINNILIQRNVTKQED